MLLETSRSNVEPEKLFQLLCEDCHFLSKKANHGSELVEAKSKSALLAGVDSLKPASADEQTRKFSVLALANAGITASILGNLRSELSNKNSPQGNNFRFIRTYAEQAALECAIVDLFLTLGSKEKKDLRAIGVSAAAAYRSSCGLLAKVPEVLTALALRADTDADLKIFTQLVRINRELIGVSSDVEVISVALGL